jgi:phenylpropionate dioxygenase-like ring-hydroxylating dioxygenase large terminal subunit
MNDLIREPREESADGEERRASIARVTRAWYVLCEAKDLGAEPLGRKLHGRALVLFRDAEGRASTLLDRCAHRNVPLSLGRMTDERHVECPYHGWQYDREGNCRRIPGLCGKPELPRRAVPSFATREQDGFVWAWATPDVEPESEPFALPSLGERYTTVRRAVEVEATLHATAENALDVPHTAFLHKGLFRGAGERNVVRAVLTRSADRVVVEYQGEPRPAGLAGRILSPSGGTVTHFDRFILPSIAQVEYGIGDENHILVTSICTPVDDFVTRMYAVVAFRTRLPGFLVKRILDPIAMRIFQQDAAMLKVQTDAIRRWGSERYTSTAADLMGPQIWRLLVRAEQGKGMKEGDETWRREIDLEV